MTIRWRALSGTLTHGAFPAWLAIGGVVLACIIAWLLSRIISTDAAAAVRYAGTLLQVAGLMTVAWGLHNVRKLFPWHLSVGRRIRNWFGQVAAAFRPPKPITAQARAVGEVSVAGKVRVRRGVGPNASVEQRLDVLEGTLNAIQEEMDVAVHELMTKVDRLGTDLGNERAERKQADDTTMQLIDKATVGGLNLEVVGLFWLTLGVLGQGIPDELLRLISLLAHPR
jgi:hypothetical protein